MLKIKSFRTNLGCKEKLSDFFLENPELLLSQSILYKDNPERHLANPVIEIAVNKKSTYKPETELF